MNTAEIYLLGRKCLKIPSRFAISNKDYIKAVFGLLNTGWASDKVEFVIGCYSRSILPVYIENTGVIVDIHYIELLGDLEQWHRTKDNRLLESMYFKYLKSIALAHSNNPKAAFYEWLISEKGYAVQPFSVDDYKMAFLVNSMAVFHESAHFVNGYEEFGALFEEYIAHDPYFKERSQNYMEKLKRESECDFMGIYLLTKVGNSIPQEQIVELYFRMIVGNCFYKTCELHFNGIYDDQEEVFGYIDRANVIVRFLNGMGRQTFPGLDMKSVSLEALHGFPDGLQHLSEFIPVDLKVLIDEYNTLPESYKTNLYHELIKQEKKLFAQREYDIYPIEKQ